MQPPKKANTSYKVCIRDIIKGNYVKKENELNYIDVHDKKIYRVNLLGTLVIKNPVEGAYIILDDGTDKLPIRSFDNPHLFDNYSVGDILLVIGKPREYGNERYLIPEIIKKIDDQKWIKVRELELKKEYPQQNTEDTTYSNLPTEEQIIQQHPSAKIFKIIEEMDTGSGVDIDAVIKKVNLENADKIITDLIKEGSIYEVIAGRIKLV